MLFPLISLVALSCVISDKIKIYFPDRNERQEYLEVYSRHPRPSVKLNQTSFGGGGELGSIGNPIKVLFWNGNMGFNQDDEIESQIVDFNRDPSWTSDCPVDCLLTNRRGALGDVHIVVYADLVDKDSKKQLKTHQMAAILAKSPVMYYQENELLKGDFLISFNKDADIRFDESYWGIIGASIMNETSLDTMQGELVKNNPKDVWLGKGIIGKIPTLKDRYNATIGLFLEDCISFDGALAKGYVQEFARYFNVHSYGTCLRDAPTNINARDYRQVIETMRKYRFVLIIEHTRVDDYLSPQIYFALVAGAIPIYLGAPNISSRFTLPNIVYNVGNMTPKQLADDLYGKRYDEEFFTKYHWWRGKGVVPFPTENSLTRRGPNSIPCEICKWYESKLHQNNN